MPRCPTCVAVGEWADAMESSARSHHASLSQVVGAVDTAKLSRAQHIALILELERKQAQTDVLRALRATMTPPAPRRRHR